MSLPGFIMWAVVLAIGVPSAWRNPTAGALVLCWVAAKTIFLVTGNGLATDYYIFPDLFVLAIICAKPEVCSLRPYASSWHQLKCVLLERSVPDRIVMLLFPIEWAVYASNLHPYYAWWSLWALSILQYFAAGWEGFSKLLRTPPVKADHPYGDVFHRVAWGHG